jgi:SpoVK/Ycf46/Vps4 family AAA+-type ATPase
VQIANFDALVDPTTDNSIIQGIHDEIIVPTLVSVNERPAMTASFMLFGPAGTRKTTLVASLAEALAWPLITLSPPAFLKHGIEGFEATADQIFEDLMHLRRAVVLFDECEEFFRWRPPATTIESRTVGAFITSGMLPRLQRLRDQRWIVFVINSNTEAFELDDAVTRRGRLDKAARVGHPVLEAQLRYLDRWRSRQSQRAVPASPMRWLRKHLRSVDAEMGPIRLEFEKEIQKLQRQHPNRGSAYRRAMAELDAQTALQLTKVVTFSMLDSLASRCLGEGTGSRIESSDQLRENLEQEFNRFGPDSFNPSVETDSDNSSS